MFVIQNHPNLFTIKECLKLLFGCLISLTLDFLYQTTNVVERIDVFN